MLISEKAKVNGSLTIEAAFIIPIVLAIMSLTMQTGIELYQECKQEAMEILQEEDLDTIEMFRRWKVLGEFVTDAG